MIDEMLMKFKSMLSVLGDCAKAKFGETLHGMAGDESPHVGLAALAPDAVTPSPAAGLEETRGLLRAAELHTGR